MTTFAIGRYALSLSAAAAFLASCSGSQPPVGPAPLGMTPQKSLQTNAYHILHEFGKSAGDGTNPYAGLIVVKGTLYGTTPTGGAYNAGTVFSITKAGQETVLHSFSGEQFTVSSDGAAPAAALVYANGMLYGTTSAGGANMCGGVTCGTVFSITLKGQEKVLRSFEYSKTDGHIPEAPLIDVDGTLYGTTLQGGAIQCEGLTCGTVFSITPSGTEKLVYSFGSQTNDGIYPQAALLDVDGKLYGTTTQGGKYNRGSVFMVSTAGKETVLYSFGADSNDGTDPSAALIFANGALYGTTEHGPGPQYAGTVFSITKFGRERSVFNFNGGDGSQPIAGLVSYKGLLYGTTLMGGTKNVGALFSLSTQGSETVLHSFSAGSGKNPYSGLVVADGLLYGTTYGSIYDHHGNVYSFAP